MGIMIYQGVTIKEIAILVAASDGVLAVIHPDLNETIIYGDVEVLFNEEYGTVCEQDDGQITYHPVKKKKTS